MQLLGTNPNDNFLVISHAAIAQMLNTFKQEILEGFNPNPQPLQSTVDEPLSEERVANILGVCTRTIRNRLKAREMEYIEIRGKRYVRSSELDRYLALHSIPRKKRD